MIAADVGERILLVLADRALHARHRVMASKLSVFSDGAASCLVTGYELIADSPRFRVEAIGMRSRVRLDAAGAGATLLTTVELIRDAAAVLRDVGRGREAYRHVMLSNYRVNSQRFPRGRDGLSTRVAGARVGGGTRPLLLCRYSRCAQRAIR